jgi:hypothetical protein
MIRQFVHLIHKRQLYATPLSDIPIKKDIIKPHEIAEAEEKELTDWGKVRKSDTGLDDVEPSKDGYENYWANQLSSGEDYSEIEKQFIRNNQQIIKQNKK